MGLPNHRFRNARKMGMENKEKTVLVIPCLKTSVVLVNAKWIWINKEKSVLVNPCCAFLKKRPIFYTKISGKKREPKPKLFWSGHLLVG